jgi:hypothetical protein
MEPDDLEKQLNVSSADNIESQSKDENPSLEANKKAFDDMRGEGIEVMNDTNGPLENEFTPESKEAQSEEKAAAAEEAFAELKAMKPLPKVETAKEAPEEIPKAAPQGIPKAPVFQAPEEQKVSLADALASDIAAIGGSGTISGPRPPAPKNDPSIKPLRTFKSDAEEAVRYQNVSTIDIAIAEQKKKERLKVEAPVEHTEEKKSSAGLFMLIVLMLIVIMGGGWYYWFTSTQGKETERQTVPTIVVRTIIPYSKGSTIYLEPKSDPLSLISAKLSASNAGLGNIYALIPSTSATSTVWAPVTTVFSGTRMPSRLSRSLGPEYMIGLYTYDTSSPFVILKDTFFQNAFAGMLEWESDMRNDLLLLAQVAHPKEAIAAEGDKFDDAVVSNIDARVLRNAAGEIILAYAFADKDTIVITTGTSTLKYLLDQLLTVKTVQ